MSRLQEARDLLAATEDGAAECWAQRNLCQTTASALDLLAAMVAEVERLERLTLADEQCHDCGGMNLSHYDGRNVCQQCGWSAVDG